jgi:hypothetical protein
VNVGPSSVRLPSAVAFSSSSSESEPASYSTLGILLAGTICSFELVMTRSSSLSLSSYSSWLLVLVCRASRLMCDGPATLRRLRELGSCCTRRPVVTISSPIEEREDEDGCEAISTQDSSFRNRGGTPDLVILSVFLGDLLCDKYSLSCRDRLFGGGILISVSKVGFKAVRRE